jgi:DNA-directed RNA polymerase subunit alpha
MEVSTELEINLFGESIPNMEELSKLSAQVHGSELDESAFADQLEENLSKGGAKDPLSSGIGLYIVGRYEEAVAKLAKGTDCVEKCFYLAYALRQLGRFDEALASLDKCAEFDADALAISLEKAATYRYSGDLEAAEEQLRGCENFEKVSSDYHYQVGSLKEAQGLYEDAIENYTAAIELSEHHRKAIFRLAYRYDMCGDSESAIDYYRQIAGMSPVSVNALLNLTVLYEDKEEFDKASDCVSKILKFHPNHARAHLYAKDIESSKTMFYDEDRERRRDMKTQILETPISDFELSVRSRNCFRKMNIRTLGDLVNITEAELLAYKNFGETSLKEIKFILESKGLYLGGATEDIEQIEEEGAAGEEGAKEKGLMLSKSVDELGLSVRARKCLQKLGLHTLGELAQKTEAELLGCKNFGVTSLNEIKLAMENIGLSLRVLE